MPSPSLRIGLLGGSFNPAHAGHVHVSMEAIKRLKLDYVWWLVSPQNPLKPIKGMAPYEKRFASAQAITKGQRRIKVSDFEKQQGLHYTHATLKAITQKHKGMNFVWLMGADNLASFHRWQHWRDIISIMPVAIFDRAPFSHTALRKKAATTLRGKRLREYDIASLPNHKGKWVYVLMRRHGASSTAIRQSQKTN
jgi:nicotinate-nucleotide adenylyltransferase